ncbi:MAG TPA: proton-conducting transporter membrane subunit [bacterium]
MNQILYIIFFPVLAGLLAYFVKLLRNELNFMGFFLTLFFSIQLFIITRTSTIAYTISVIPGVGFRFYLDSLSGLVLLFISAIAFLIWFYALRAMLKTPRERIYYLYVAVALSVANIIVVSGSPFMLSLALAVMVFLIYKFLLIGKKDSTLAARRAAVINGLAVFLIIVGIGMLLMKHSDGLSFPVEPRIGFDGPLPVISFILMSIGALVLAGAIPSEIWSAEAATVVPASTMAFIPASLNNLLGIYLLIRSCYYIFNLSNSLLLRLVIMAIGSMTVLVALIKTIAQDDAMRILSFHTVAQVGFVVLGIGTGSPVGVAGGLFHMINSVISKAGLILSAGSVEFRTKTTRLSDFRGIIPRMPFTAIAFIITALAISDVPPLNGFYSKWMLYQGIMELSGQTILWPVFLLVMISGSVLAVMSLMKMVYIFFLSKRPEGSDRVCEIRFEMMATTLVFALACIVFGVLVHQIPLSKLVYPSLPFKIPAFSFGSSVLATVLVMAGFIVGLVILIFGKTIKRQSGLA